MALTGKLGTADSQWGNIILGGGAAAAQPIIRNISESLVLTETKTASIRQIYTRNVSENIVFFQSFIKASTLYRDISQTLTLSEEAEIREPLIFNLNVTESITLAQALPRNITANEPVANTITLSEVILRGASRHKQINESVPIDERLIHQKSKITSKSETITLGETLTNTKSLNLAITEQLVLTELNSRAMTYGRIVNEHLPLKGGMIKLLQAGNQEYWAAEVEAIKAIRKCIVILECPQTSTQIVLPCPSFGDSEKSLHSQVIKRSINNVLYTYIRRNDLQQLNYTFVLGRGKCLDLQEFLDTNIDKMITMTNWKSEIWKVYVTNNPLEYAMQALFENEGERCEVSIEFQGVKVLG